MGLAILFFLMWAYGHISGEAAFGWWLFAEVMIFLNGPSKSNSRETIESTDDQTTATATSGTFESIGTQIEY